MPDAPCFMEAPSPSAGRKRSSTHLTCKQASRAPHLHCPNPTCMRKHIYRRRSRFFWRAWVLSLLLVTVESVHMPRIAPCLCCGVPGVYFTRQSYVISELLIERSSHSSVESTGVVECFVHYIEGPSLTRATLNVAGPDQSRLCYHQNLCRIRHCWCFQ